MPEPRHVQIRNEFSDSLKESSLANTYQMYVSKEQMDSLSAMEKVLGKFKKFLKFLSSLTRSEWLHFMNHACVKPERADRIKHKHLEAPKPAPMAETLTEVAISSPADPAKPKASRKSNKKRRRFFRFGR